MGNSYQLRGHIVNPLSGQAIRDIASYTRGVLGLGDEAVNMESFLERLHEFGITKDVVSDEDMPGFSFHSEACCVPENATIYLTEETYYKACNNDPRTRFTIFHELGHLILGHTRQLHRANLSTDVKPYEDSEWQADRFSAEVIMPLEVIMRLKLDSVSKLKAQFMVSEPAARTRFEQLKKERLI